MPKPNLFDKLQKMEQIFSAELAEEPAMPPNIHRIHFTEEQLMEHQQTLYEAQQALTRRA